MVDTTVWGIEQKEFAELYVRYLERSNVLPDILAELIKGTPMSSDMNSEKVEFDEWQDKVLRIAKARNLVAIGFSQPAYFIKYDLIERHEDTEAPVRGNKIIASRNTIVYGIHPKLWSIHNPVVNEHFICVVCWYDRLTATEYLDIIEKEFFM